MYIRSRLIAIFKIETNLKSLHYNFQLSNAYLYIVSFPDPVQRNNLTGCCSLTLKQQTSTAEHLTNSIILENKSCEEKLHTKSTGL